MIEAATTEPADHIAERAIALARASMGADEAARELAAAGRDNLEKARTELVRRVYLRSDDYEATAALSLVNRALAAAGWENPYDWRRRRKP